MKTVSYNELTKAKQKKFLKFLQQVDDTSPAFENMWDDNWENKPNTLPYMLEKTDKFKSPNGDYFVIYDDTNIVGMGGVYFSSFNRLIAIGGVRTWVNKTYRNKALLKEHLLPQHRAWAIKNNCKQIALTFNDYNKNVIEIFKRNRPGYARTERKEHNMFYNNFNELDFPVVIQKTKQWVVYESLDSNWDWKWKTIAVQ